MNKNALFDLTVTGLSNDGCGVGRYGGMAVFVPFSAAGDELSVRALKITKSAVYGKIERIIKPSADRIIDGCGVFGRCGGCDFRHISYEAELRAKEVFIRDAFTRVGKLSPEFQPITGGGESANYRNKAQYPVGLDKSGGAVYGFYAVRSHRIISLYKGVNCALHPDVFGEIADFITDFIREKRLSVYDEAAHGGDIRRICIRRGHYSGEINVTLVARRKVPELSEAARRIMKNFPAVKGVTLNVNPDKTNAVLGKKEIALAGESDITDTMNGNKIVISPRSFYQVNTPAAEALYGIVSDFAEPGGKLIADLYCGIGAIGLSAADRAKGVIGVELSESAVGNAAENARLNGFANTRFFHGDAAAAARTLASEGVRPDVVILDPARKGCDETALEGTAALSPERIVMVSCNPATAARDCARLAKAGYKTTKVRGCDLFPRTRHVECAALLEKGNYP
ncbi:MAG: 23S rRNA (uracil(1939)-C(5))-methyltransferase RlmD [Oscillospiraceae bacterium]|jgi:23S rRNA (uracil1939-C5)-methyltransferase|nr:23S rRNA (uracil(1939)-C(5))-methyltransferase RlmD [Oscillospiraceae bacterium]